MTKAKTRRHKTQSQGMSTETKARLQAHHDRNADVAETLDTEIALRLSGHITELKKFVVEKSTEEVQS